MTKEQAESEVAGILSLLLKMPVPAGGNLTMQNAAAWNSLKHIEVLFAIEERLGFQIPETELENTRTQGALVELAVKYAT